jgi:hypothetical protein
MSAAQSQQQAAQANLEARLEAVRAEHTAALQEQVDIASKAAQAQSAQLQQHLDSKTQQLKLCHIELTEAQEELENLRCKGKQLLTYQGTLHWLKNCCLQVGTVLCVQHCH